MLLPGLQVNIIILIAKTKSLFVPDIAAASCIYKNHSGNCKNGDIKSSWSFSQKVFCTQLCLALLNYLIIHDQMKSYTCKCEKDDI